MYKSFFCFLWLIMLFFSSLMWRIAGGEALAQNPDIKRTMHWYFGLGAGLDFSSGTAIADTTGKANDFERAVTMSDTCGNLLFYVSTDSSEYYLKMMDRNHQPMPNGTIAACCNPTQFASVPQPGNDSLFYLFYSHKGGSVSGQFLYAIININANGGMGDVISKDNVLFSSMATEKVGITQHCNGVDYWVASKQTGKGSPIPIADQLYVWQLTASGLNLTPVVSSPGNIEWENGDGYFRFSNDGTMAAVAYIHQATLYYTDSSYFEVYQFDNCTGLFSNAITVQHPQPNGLIFSPDNTKLYVSVLDLAGLNPGDIGYLSQYDLSTYNQTFVETSRTILDSGYIGNGLQLGLDGKVYVSGLDTALADYGLKKLGVINNPNTLGFACNYVKEQIDLLGKDAWVGLPYFPDNYFKDFNFTNCTTSISENEVVEPIVVFPNPFDNFITIHYTEPYYLKIIDITGKLILERIILEDLFRLNTTSFSQGIYIVNITSKNKHSTNHKIIKL